MKLFNCLLQLLTLDVRHVRNLVLLIAVLALSSTPSVAQWATNGNDINNTNTGFDWL